LISVAYQEEAEGEKEKEAGEKDDEAAVWHILPRMRRKTRKRRWRRRS
jgi:hypothetical protein